MGIQDRPALSVACIAGIAFGMMLAASAPAAASTITEFPLPAGTTPGVITAGPDGALWFTELSPPGPAADKIGRITTAGSFSEFVPPTPSFLRGITSGPDGALWFTEWSFPGNIGRLTTGGSFTEFHTPTAQSGPFGITAGPDGALWFTESRANKIGRVTTSGSFTEFPIPTANSGPIGITTGSDGALWFAELGANNVVANKIGRVTTSGSFSEFPIPTAGSGAQQIAAGPDGAQWFTEPFANPRKIGRIATTGTIREFSDPILSEPNYITAGSDGALWFSNNCCTNTIGRLTTGGSFSAFPIPTPEEGPGGITAGPDGALWFTEPGAHKIGTISPAAIVDSSITAVGMPVAATEGSPFTGTIATFTDPDTEATASEYSATIDWGDGSPVDTGVIIGGSGSFSVSGTHTYSEEGTYAVTVTITDVDNAGNNAAANSTANVADATLGASCATPAVSSMSFSGNVASLTDANPFATASDFTATINWGDSSSSTGTVSGPMGGPFAVSGTHSYAATGTFTITTSIAEDGGSTASTTCSVIVFAVPSSGNFVIGDGNATVGTNVTFWGAQWANHLNSVSGGAAPAAFKGFEDTPPVAACGVTWSTDPGNSTPPPAGPLPTFMAVIVSSSISMSGSTISGNTVHIVIVKTNAGYQPDLGHAGTGTVVAMVC